MSIGSSACARKITAMTLITSLLMTLVSPVFAAVLPTFVALETIPSSPLDKQVVTLTPADVVDGLTFSATIDGNTVSYNSTPTSTIATVTAVLAAGLTTATVGCVDNTTHITCTANVAGIPFTYSTDVDDIGAPTVPTNLFPNGTATDNDFDFTWDASTDEVVGAITYEFKSSQSNSVDGFGVLNSGVWTSGALTSPMIHSSGAPDGIWYWQVRAKDAAGNYSAWSPVVSMTIDSVPPVITIDPYTTTTTNADVIVTVSTNEGSLNTAAHTFTANGSFTFTATDAAGNSTDSTVTITNIDKAAPVITLNGSTPMDVSFGAAYVEPGASCTDNVDLVCSVIINGSVVTNTLGTYFVTYDATDFVGNASPQAQRTVNVVDVEKPIITLLGTATVTVAQNSVYSDAGATALDNVDGDITGGIVMGGSVDTSTLGNYILTYDVTDSSLNAALQVTRTVTVTDQTAPTLAEVIPVTTPTNDNTPSYTFSSDEAGTITYGGGCTSSTTTAIAGNNPINFDLLADGTYNCTISVTDNALNTTTLPITSFTIDTTDPAVTIDQAGTQGDPTATSTLFFTAVLSEPIVDATFTCDDILATNAICDSVTNIGANTYTVQVHALAAGIATVSVVGGGISDFAGNTNTDSTSTDNSVHFTASGGGGLYTGGPSLPSTSETTTSDDTSDTAPDTTEDEVTEDDTLLSRDDEDESEVTPPSTPADDTADQEETDSTQQPQPIDNSELISTSFPDSNSTPQPTTTTRPRPNASTPSSASFGNDDAESSTETPETTEEPREEPEVVADATEIEAVTQDIGGGEPSEKPSNVLPWTLLGLIAVLNFAWFYTRKPPTIPQ